MPKTTDHIARLSSLEQFLGENVQVTDRQYWDVNRFIRIQVLMVTLSENELREENAHLHFYPVNDHEFFLQLLYLQHTDDQSKTATVHRIEFLPGFFDQYPPEILMANHPFRFDRTTDQPFNFCSQSLAILDQLKQRPYPVNAFAAALQECENCLQLLRRALQAITVPFTSCQVPACRFLSNEGEREKIMQACLLIEQNPGHLYTIKELSKKVAINECYLKKGFKALVGKAVHEYQHELRITKAKTLLQEQGKSVSDVALTLGFSSISHFSTAFKKATGIKPCELLA